MKKWVFFCYMFCIKTSACLVCTCDVPKDLADSRNSCEFSAPLHVNQITAVQKSLLSSKYNTMKSQDWDRNTYC